MKKRRKGGLNSKMRKQRTVKEKKEEGSRSGNKRRQN